MTLHTVWCYSTVSGGSVGLGVREVTIEEYSIRFHHENCIMRLQCQYEELQLDIQAIHHKITVWG